MSKNKFILTADMVTVAPEPMQVDNTSEDTKKPKKEKDMADKKEQLSFRVSSSLKKNFQIWCVTNNKNMSEVLEEFMIQHIKN